jgi:hypothetical protein
MNLDYVKPFSNTSDLINKTPIIHDDIEKQKKEEEKQKEDELKKAKLTGESAKKTITLEEDEEKKVFKAKEGKKSKSDMNEES